MSPIGGSLQNSLDAHLGIVLSEGGCLGFLGLQLCLGRFGLHWQHLNVEGVSATKVVGFLLGVNGSKISQNAQTPCKH